jgi:DNA-binding transcriptional regulator YiaG
MTPTEYRAQLARLGLSQTKAAKVLGLGDRTSRSYATGEREPPEPVVRLLAACERYPALLAELISN